MKDIDIVKLYETRDEDAVLACSDKYGRLIKNIVGNLLSDSRDVDEVVSDTYLTLWEHIPPDKPEHLGAYICRVAKNLAFKKLEYDHAKKRHSNYVLAIDELSESIPDDDDVEQRVLEDELKGKINSFLRELPKEKRIMFIRRYWYMDSVKNIAKDYGISEKAASMALNRIRCQLKQYLMYEWFDD